MGLWGLVATPAPVAWSTWLTKTLPQDAEAGGGLMVAIIQLAITLGATIGGLLFDWQGYQATFILNCPDLSCKCSISFNNATYSNHLAVIRQDIMVY